MLGTGTKDNPFLISNPADLQAIDKNLTAYYELTNDIDMTGYSFKPIGRVHPFFSGNLDGKGYKINNLRVVDNAEYTSFIARTNEGSSIKNLGLENIYVESSHHHVAGLIALNYTTTVSNCYVTGSIKQTISSRLYAGGLVARNYGLVENCYTDCTVTGGDSVGGFIGHVANELSVIKNNYSKSTITGSKNVGAFFGTTEAAATFSNNYYDNQVAGVANTLKSGVIGKTTEEMKTQSSFTNWDFVKVWYMDGYPKLRLFAGDLVTSKKETITVNSFSNPLQPTLSKCIKATKSLQANLSRIYTVNNRQIKTQRVNVTYSLPIHSSVQKSNRTVRNMTVNIDSHIKPIGSYANRESKTIKQLISHLKPLQADISVLYPLRDIPVYATVSVQYNPSRASLSENMSRSHYIENPSYSEVI